MKTFKTVDRDFRDYDREDLLNHIHKLEDFIDQHLSSIQSEINMMTDDVNKMYEDIHEPEVFRRHKEVQNDD